MKSKIQFDLNGLNQAVVSAKIANTEDVRDKVAKSFTEGFGYDSVLATVYHIHHSTWRDEENTERGMSHIEIRPVGSKMKDCQALASLLGDTQLELLNAAINRELAFRKRTGIGNAPYFHGEPIECVVRDYSVEDKTNC